MKTRWMFSLIAVLFTSWCWAQPKATLRVEVYDIVTGSNLSQATVRVVSSDNSIDRTASTGSGNAVSFTNLPITLSYRVTVSRAEYRERSLAGIILARDTTNDVSCFLTSTLQTVGSVAGTVRDALSGQPLAGATVTANLSGRVVWVLTDNNGVYRIDDLPRATYTMGADALGYRAQGISASVAPGTVTSADMVLTPLTEPVGTLRGKTYDLLSGGNVNNATVTLISDLGWSLTVNTGGGNSYQWTNLPARTRYRLAATAENYRTSSRVNIVLSVDDATDVDLFMASVLTSVGTLTGRIYDIRTGDPIPGAFVQVATSGRPISVFTDSNGVYEINNLPPIQYQLYARAPAYYDQTLDNVSVQQGMNTANVLLTPLDMPVGTWRFRGYDFGTGANVNNVVIRITAPNGLSMTTSSGAGGNSDEIGNLPVGMLLRVEAFAPNYRSRRYDNRKVRRDQIDEFQLWLVSEDINVGRLQGRVTDLFTGSGIPSAYVLLSQVNTGRWALVYTDMNGEFSINDLLPTTYHVYIGGAGYYENIAYNIPIAVGDNLLEYALTPFNYPSGRLYGDVTNAANNQGISNAVVLLVASTGTTRLTYTGSGSRFDFYNLAYDLTYTVVGRAAGFQPGRVSNIEVPAFGEVYIRLLLNAGQDGLIGRLVLQDFGGDPVGIQALVQIRDRDTGQVIREDLVTLGESGALVIPNVPAGTYKVWNKASHWLSSLTDGITIPNLLPVALLSGPNGDIDNDNEITLFDFGQLVAAFGSIPGDPNWNPSADLDGDLEVTLFDFGILVQNFGEIGEE
ncbi:MAG: hypothetical protein KatS3mg023_0461 [Armatimonadota bacterium]|nr:MAG: hypothetical protein KatS3mg023_0461 [Armatimonadota bacterium]